MCNFWAKLLQVYNCEKGVYNSFKVDVDHGWRRKRSVFFFVNEINLIFARKHVPILHTFPMKQELKAQGHPYLIAKISAEFVQEAWTTKDMREQTGSLSVVL